MIGRSVSHYKILERIGGGGMGVVYRAEDTKLRRTVALKFLPHELGGDEVAKKRFIREAQAASALDHPNICNIFEIDETPEGQLFIAMAFYTGESLKQTLARGPLDVREAFEVATAMAQGLSRAHKNGIVHRDIKPANVMVTDDGFVKIVDFGLAKLEGVTQVTKSQFTVGTISYMSPEQAAGEHVDERTDIWALGVVLYEMLTGAIPWQGGVDQAILYSIMSSDPTPVCDVVPDVPKTLSDIILKCLAKDPKERYQTIDELIVDCGDVARELGWGSSVVARSVVPIIRAKHRRWTRIATIAAAAVVVIAAGVGGWQRWGPQAEHSVYVTKNRIAVLPLTNMMGIAQSSFSNGLSEVVSMLAEEATRKEESTWVVPYDKVVAAPIAKPQDAIGAFGVNQVVIGSLQKFADRQRLSLSLCNASDMRVLTSVSVTYDSRTMQGLADSLDIRVASLLGTVVPDSTDFALHRPTVATTMAPLMQGLGLLQGDPLGTQLDAAIGNLRNCVKDDPGFGLGLATLGRAYTKRFRLTHEASTADSARSYFGRVLSSNPGSVYANINAARLYLSMELYPEAIEHYRKVLARAPGHPLASLRLAMIFNGEGRFDEAEALFHDSIRRHPDYWETHFELGVLYYFRDRLDDALDQWEMALRYAKNDVTTLNNIGAVYHVTGQWARARPYFERAFQIRPTCQTCQNMGMSYFYEGKYSEATKYYEFALEYCDTTDYKTWGNLAASQYWVEGERDEARQRYRVAMRLAMRKFRSNPEDANVIAALIDYSTKAGDWDTGMRMIAYGDSVAGDDPDFLVEAGDAYERHGQRSLALRYVGNAVRRGYPIVEIERTPSLKSLVSDPVFKQMISDQQAGDTSPSSSAGPQ